MEILTRRKLLQLGVLTGSGMLLSSAPFGWAFAGETPAENRLVMVMLRGAVDGLNAVAPYRDAAYRNARPSIGLQAPGVETGVTDLDGYFGLHPALAGLMPLWRSRQLAFIQACGSPDPTRSHFEAQIFMENGTPGTAVTPDGWMNRLVGVLPGPKGPTRAVSLGPTRPHILAGSQPTTNLALGHAGKPGPTDRPMVAASFGGLYDGTDVLSKAYQQGKLARQELAEDMVKEDEAGAHQDPAADNGAPHPAGFPMTMRRLADLLKTDPRIQLAFIDLGGWDTHVNQGAAQGQLANHLKLLGDGLAAFAADLGPMLAGTTVLVMSEFGRTVKENGGGGTDHGHGNVMWALGGPIAGGRVLGQWPGLDSAALYQGRDLAVTTDFRSVIAVVLERHLRLRDTELAVVFPTLPRDDSKLSSLLRA